MVSWGQYMGSVLVWDLDMGKEIHVYLWALGCFVDYVSGFCERGSNGG